MPPQSPLAEIEDRPGPPEVLRARLSAFLDDRHGLGRPQWPQFAFGAAMLVAFAVILRLNRGTTLTPDELSFFLTSPELSARQVLEPYGGQFALTARIEYWAIFEIFGSGYLPFRVLAALTVVTTAGLFYVYASRAIGRVAALAPSLVLLLFGPDALHVLAGNTFGVLLPIACGIGALLALDRGDRTGDSIACALLCLAVVTFGTGLAVTVGVAVAILLRADRWRRAWIVLIPVTIYAAWWLWARSSTEADSGVALSNALLIPAWGFESLGGAISSIVGLNYEFDGAPQPIEAGPALALAALGALAWRVKAGPLPRPFWPPLAAALTLWALQALAAEGSENFPASPHYMFPVTILVLLVVVEAVRGLRLSPVVLLAVFGVTAVALATNFSVLRDRAAGSRYEYAPQARAALAGLDIAGERADPAFAFGGLDLPPGLFAAFVGAGANPTSKYLAATERFGRLGYRPEELSDGSGKGKQPYEAAYADLVLVTALHLGVEPVPRDTRRAGCRQVGLDMSTFPVNPGDAVIVEGASGPVEVRRFSGLATRKIGTATAGRPFLVRIPPDRAPNHRWQVSVAGSSLRVCDAG
jgi:hypothetical protein